MTKSIIGLHQERWKPGKWGAMMMELRRVNPLDTWKKLVSMISRPLVVETE